MIIQPSPLTTNLTDNNRLTKPWEIWFRNISQNLVNSTKYTTTSGVDYSLNGSLLFLNYSGNGDLNFILPYPSAINQILTYHFSTSSIYTTSFIDISQNDSTIFIPAKENIKITGTLLIKQSNR